METSVHRQLKLQYAATDADTEVRLDGFRIDAIRDGQLIEIQHGPLAAIRDKIRRLCERHRVLVVKPLIRSKLLVKLAGPDGPVVQERRSPKRGDWLDLFDELVYFTRTFPHPNLLLEVIEIDVAELRYPGHGRRRRWRRRDHVVADQRIVGQGITRRFATAHDLVRLLPGPLPQKFHTGELAQLIDGPRWRAQRIAYCLRQMGAIAVAGKLRNTIVYRRVPAGRRKRAA